MRAFTWGRRAGRRNPVAQRQPWRKFAGEQRRLWGAEGSGRAPAVGLGLLSSSSVRHCTVIIDTGASANLVGVNRLNNHKAILSALGRPLAKTAPAFASSRHGDGRVGGVHRAAIIPIAIVGYTGQFTAYVADADIPALLGREALETLGRHLNFRQRVLTLVALGVDIPLGASAVGHYIS